MGRKVLFDGEIKYKDSIKINPESPALNFGCGLFETVLYEKNRIFFYTDHIERLKKACVDLDIMLPERKHLDQKKIIELIKENGFEKKPVRVKLLYAPLTGGDKWNLTASVKEYNRSSDPIEAEVDLKTADEFLRKYKTVSYMRSYLSIKKKKENEELLFVNSEGEVTEGSRTNILCIKDGILYHTGKNENFLQGIMQGRIIGDFKSFGLKNTMEMNRGFTHDFLKDAEEILLTNSLMIARSVSKLLFGKKSYTFSSQEYSKKIRNHYIK